MICIIGSETTENYGLFNDILHSPDFRIVYTKPPFLYGTVAWRILRRLRRSILKKTMRMSWEKTILKDLEEVERIIVVDTALRWLELSFLDKCKGSKPDLQIDCLLLNSIDSLAFSEHKIRSKFYSFSWNTVLTFDPQDAEKYNWQFTGLCYYSKHSLPASAKIKSDLFFAGSIMGKRGKDLLHLLDCFNANRVECHFICPSLGLRYFITHYFKRPKGMSLILKRISYKSMLKKMITSNCILEVLQEGQSGSTLRYFEAVCYNKKLLTTNTEIKNYPFYDDRYMRVFSSGSDIDYDWVKKQENVDYGYKNEFSPLWLFSTPQTDA